MNKLSELYDLPCLSEQQLEDYIAKVKQYDRCVNEVRKSIDELKKELTKIWR